MSHPFTMMPLDELAAYRQAARHSRKARQSLRMVRRLAGRQKARRARRHTRICNKETGKAQRIILRWMVRYVTEGGRG